MTEKTFDDAFLARLAIAMRAIAQEAAETNDPDPLQSEDYDVIYAAYAESGGDPIDAKQRIAAAKACCVQAFGGVLQYIADQYSAGPVEQLAERPLTDIARDAYIATETWQDEVAMHARGFAPRNGLHRLLDAHHRLNEAMLDLHDHILWPIARRISPGE